MADPVKQWQRIRQTSLEPSEFDLDPRTLPKYWFSNIWQRVVAQLAGWTGTKTVLVRVNNEGDMITVSGGGSVDSYDTDSGTASDAYSGTNQLTVVGGATMWNFLVESNDAKIHFSRDGGVTWGDDLTLVVGFYSFPVRATDCQIKNRNAGSNATFEMAAFYRST